MLRGKSDATLWRSYASIASVPDFDRVISLIEIKGPDFPIEEIGFLSYDNGDDDVRVHLERADNIPLPVLLAAIEKARKALLAED